MTGNEVLAESIRNYLESGVDLLLTDDDYRTIIKALEQKPILDKIRAEIETIIGEHNLDDYDFCSGLIVARKIIDKYKAESEGKEWQI